MGKVIPDFQWGRFSDHISLGMTVGNVIVELNVSNELWYTDTVEFRHTDLFKAGIVDGPNTRGVELVLLLLHFSLVWPATKKEVDDDTDYAD